MSGNHGLLTMLLDVCREHAFKGSVCRVTCTPPRCRSPRSFDCLIDSIGTAGRVNLRPLFGQGHLTVPIRRVLRVELLR